MEITCWPFNPKKNPKTQNCLGVPGHDCPDVVVSPLTSSLPTPEARQAALQRKRLPIDSMSFSVHSSFDEYSSELKSGRLEWSPVHKSEKFWRENAVRLNEKNYELLK